MLHRHSINDWQKHLTKNIFVGFLYKFVIGYYFGQVLLPIVDRMAMQHGGIFFLV
jgi:hypothetical protein